MRALFLLYFLLLSLVVSGDEPRIVAVGDVHGDLQSFQSILRTAEILDASGNWTGGNSIFVQTGDAIDRGSQGKQVLDLIMKLESQAPARGGRVHSLLGNHEVMNMMGDLRYVPAAEFANFADARSESRLKEAFESFKEFQRRKAERRKLAAPVFTQQQQDEWFKAHPRGYLEHMEAYGPNGKYGKWLRKQNAVLDLRKNIFVHGGISPKIASMTVADINDRIRKEVQLFDRLKLKLIEQKTILPFYTFDEMIDAAKEELAVKQKDETLETFLQLGSWLSIFPEGPLWFRGYAQWTNEELTASLPSLLSAYKARRFIVGHTVVKNGEILVRHDHAVVIIDTGMNRTFYPQGRASALLIDQDKLTAVYGDKRVALKPE